MRPETLETFLHNTGPAITIRVTEALGSAPREAGAWMLVSSQEILDTIGGGRLEQMAIEAARAMLVSGEAMQVMDIPLGPEIGQCCGGRVRLQLSRAEPVALRAEARAAWNNQPDIYVFGAGHVGRAITDLLQYLPFNTRLVDSREDQLALCLADIDLRLTPLPEAEIEAAGPGAAYIILTHDHGLDFLLTSAALARGDAAYVGLIGSATKCARFERWHGGPAPALTCPIGGPGGDKRPAIIAALVVAEVVRALTSDDQTAVGHPV